MATSSLIRRKSSQTPNGGQSSPIPDVNKSTPTAPAARKTMTAVFIDRSGGPNALVPREVDCPKPDLRPYEVLIRVAYVGVNRLDLDQRRKGHKGVDETRFCPGLECSGVIEAVGERVRHKVGDHVCAFLDSGGYTEQIVVSSSRVLYIPPGMDLRDAACLPEAAYTGWRALSAANLRQGATILIHETCGDVAVFAIQMAKYMGAQVFAAADSSEKQEFYKMLGADKCFSYRSQDFVYLVRRQAGGVDVVLDSWAVNVRKNLEMLCSGGSLIYIDMHGYQMEVLQIDLLMARHAKIKVLHRSAIDPKIIQELKTTVWPAICAGRVRPYWCRSFRLSQAAQAHRFMEMRTCFQPIVSALGPWASKLERYVYTGLVEKSIRGKVLLGVDNVEEERTKSTAQD